MYAWYTAALDFISRECLLGPRENIYKYSLCVVPIGLHPTYIANYIL